MSHSIFPCYCGHVWVTVTNIASRWARVHFFPLLHSLLLQSMVHWGYRHLCKKIYFWVIFFLFFGFIVLFVCLCLFVCVRVCVCVCVSVLCWFFFYICIGQRSWACLTKKSAVEIESLLLLSLRQLSHDTCQTVSVSKVTWKWTQWYACSETCWSTDASSPTPAVLRAAANRFNPFAFALSATETSSSVRISSVNERGRTVPEHALMNEPSQTSGAAAV